MNDASRSPDATDATATPPGTLRRVVVAASLGNFVEWFDFAVYGFMATVLAANFFPAGNEVTALLQTFAVFAVAFALRPVGGLVFGALGDRIGRRRVLSWTVLLIAGSTTMIGVLPTYADIGIAATLLLCLARLIQGFSAGGEYAGACAYVLEHAPRTKKARYSSVMPISTFVAFAVAALLSYGMSAVLDPAALADWGWRVPFLVAAPLGLFGFYIRYRLSETPVFDQIGEVAHAPVRETLRSALPTMVRLGGYISASGLAFYTLTTYMGTYLQVVARVERPTALLASVVALLFAAACSPLSGLVSDRFGRRRTAAAAVGLLLVTSVPAFLLAGSQHLAPILLGQGLLALGTAATLVSVAVLMSELFPTRVRYTASAITYNVAYAVFGGTAPFLATWAISVTDDPLAPAYYLAVVSAVALGCILLLPETGHRSLADVNAAERSPAPAGAPDPSRAHR